jgi:high-affinity nickel permease
MRAFRVLFVLMALVVQLFAATVVTLASQKILDTLQAPQTLTGVISGSVSTIFMVLLMFGLFLPQFDRMSRHIALIQAARDIVEQARTQHSVESRNLNAFSEILQRYEHDDTRPTDPVGLLPGSKRKRRQAGNGHNQWPPSS